jgi:hypothetical protein
LKCIGNRGACGFLRLGPFFWDFFHWVVVNHVLYCVGVSRDLLSSLGLRLVSGLALFLRDQSVAKLIQLIQLLQVSCLEILQLDIKGLLGPDKLYRKQRDIKPLKEQLERARHQRDSPATF